jgi:phage-related protein
LTKYARSGILPQPDRLLKPVEWVGTALEELRACPEAVQDAVGYALYLAQCGEQHPAAKRLRGELRGLVEIVDDWGGNTYRAVYTASLAGVIYVLHVFRKKATRGIATPRHVIEGIKGRLRQARTHHARHYGRHC